MSTMNIILYPEQEHALRVLARARNTTPEAVARVLITIGLRQTLTDEEIEKSQSKEREQLARLLNSSERVFVYGKGDT